MKILLIGSGGRENAIAAKIFESESFKKQRGKIYCAPGNPGINRFAEPVDIKQTDIDLLLKFALNNIIDFTIVGPEVPLTAGIVNKFEDNGLKIFGPRKEAAEIESSKVFSKNLMQQNNIPTAKFKIFSKDDLTGALIFLNECRFPLVIKADGLAAGKGVIIAASFTEAEKTIKEFCGEDPFGDAGTNFVIEEFLKGEEVSVFVITDGSDYLVLPFSQDHKKIFDGNKGKNTGGMGAVAPVKKFMTNELDEKIRKQVIEPVLKVMKDEGREFKGCLYCGLMIVDEMPYVIEFNCRFGDPETQAVLPLIESDFLQLLIASSENTIKNYKLVLNNKYSCCVVMTSGGYPDEYVTGKLITGLDEAGKTTFVAHSGTKYGDNNEEILSNGGRVLSVVGVSEKSAEDAVRIAYEGVEKISFEGMYYRKDVGRAIIN
ncbi:MAG: phosphoribosylamine--glycine ligase [bacterium]